MNSIENHYKKNWSKSFYETKIDFKRYINLPKTYRILVFPPYNVRNMWTYATIGLSSTFAKTSLELHMFSEKYSFECIEVLTSVSHFHIEGKKLGLNHTVNFGIPWQKNSKCTFGLISLPYLDGPDLEKLVLVNQGSKREINFYWLIPITKRERDYKANKGIEALELRFDNGLNYLDVKRNSLV